MLGKGVIEESTRVERTVSCSGVDPGRHSRGVYLLNPSVRFGEVWSSSETLKKAERSADWPNRPFRRHTIHRVNERWCQYNILSFHHISRVFNSQEV